MTLPTFGIVTFRRPHHLRRLVESIYRYYPSAIIHVADNGIQLPLENTELYLRIGLDVGANHHILPFDCGLSASRNYLVDVTGGDLLILDDDFVFTDETDVELMMRILETDDEVGIVCGNADVVKPHNFDGSPISSHALCFPYSICDIADNFMLVRRAVFNDGVRWNPALKLREHRDFFEQVKATNWRVAFTPKSKVVNDRGTDSPEYHEYRRRKPDVTPSEPPDVVVLGVGHSGTSIVTKMLKRLGWNLGDVKAGVAENLAVQAIDKRILSRSLICPCGGDEVTERADGFVCKRCGRPTVIDSGVTEQEMSAALAAIPRPWCVKDPRMVLTLGDWLPVLSWYKPFLLLVERDIERMRRTYAKHGFGDRIYGHSIADLKAIARGEFDKWGHRKLRVAYEDVAEAVELFDLGRK